MKKVIIYLSCLMITNQLISNKIERIIRLISSVPLFRKQQMMRFCEYKIMYLRYLNDFRKLLHEGNFEYLEFEKLSKKELVKANKIDIDLSKQKGKSFDIILRKIDLQIGNDISVLEELQKRIQSLIDNSKRIKPY